MILVDLSIICNASFQPIPEGLRLVRALHAASNLVIYSKVRDDAWFKRWSLQNSLFEYDNFTYELREEEDWVPALRPRLLLTTEPLVAAWSLERGIPALLACYPQFAIPANRPPQKSWQALVEEIDRQVGLEYVPEPEPD